MSEEGLCVNIAARNRWNKRRLERHINSLLFQRLLKSRDKAGILQLANEDRTLETPLDAIKNPYVLEFLSYDISESMLYDKC